VLVLMELTGAPDMPVLAKVGADAMQDERSRFALLLGRTIVALWGQLPRDIQELVFESAADGNDADRDALAIYLHNLHPRTAHPRRPVQASSG
jgi:hypothetical protein